MIAKTNMQTGNSSTPRRQDAKTRRFFYEEAMKPRPIGKNSWFPGFLMELILFAAPPRCAFASLRLCVKTRLHSNTQ
jgi:hypothetical protein